jgi:hypothetical protein
MTVENMPEYPRQCLVFFVVQEADDVIRAAIRGMIEVLATERKWVIHAPRYVEEVYAASAGPGDVPIVTIGGVLEIYSAIGTDLPRDTDLAHLEEVECVVRATQVLSADMGIDFEFELDGVSVGTIEGGILDRSLQIGLIGEWRRHLAG